MTTSRPTLHDWLSLLYMYAAKFRRRHFTSGPREYYEGYFTERHVFRYENDFLTELRRREVVAALGGLSDGAIVLDAGCGVGDVLAGLSSGLRRFGLDYSLRSLRLAAKTCQGAWLTNGSIYELPIASGSLHAVICLEVLEHLEDDERGVSEIYRVLRAGGLLVVSVPGGHYFRAYLHLTGHYRHYSRSSLEKLLQRYGFVVERHLQHYPRLNTLYLYVYATLTLLNMASRLFGRDDASIYERRLPGSPSTIYERVRRWILEPLARQDEARDPSISESATFCLARKLV